MSHFGRKAAMGAVAFAMIGSTVFGGAALANGDEEEGTDGVTVTNTGGAGGAGGEANLACENFALQISKHNWNVKGGGAQGIAQSCTATGGAGGAGGTGATY